ncbi:hypothetical protein [Frigoriglobus tundricola]|uniref:hypothetical protein n=1 Tax=Frigoriglobus tundricola TaxID=2774151 RepID=UPI0018723583|nr:hypothetical protein [Frigoriglobus tundricola]
MNAFGNDSIGAGGTGSGGFGDIPEPPVSTLNTPATTSTGARHRPSAAIVRPPDAGTAQTIMATDRRE